MKLYIIYTNLPCVCGRKKSTFYLQNSCRWKKSLSTALFSENPTALKKYIKEQRKVYGKDQYWAAFAWRNAKVQEIVMPNSPRVRKRKA